MQLLVLSLSRSQACSFPRVIPEIDIWRAANLMLKRYGEKALEESAMRADELEAAADAAVPEIGRRTAARSLRPVQAECRRVDISTLGGNSTDDILGGQYRCHVAATLTGRLPSHAIVGVNRFSTANLLFYPRDTRDRYLARRQSDAQLTASR